MVRVIHLLEQTPKGIIVFCMYLLKFVISSIQLTKRMCLVPFYMIWGI